MNRPVFRRQGILFVVSAPSGTGKSTLCANLRATPDFIYSVSCTTRQPRPGEENGVDYHFMTKEHFEKLIAAGEMLEYATVHGNYYGTPKATVKEALEQGTDVLLDIDVQGAAQIRKTQDQVGKRFAGRCLHHAADAGRAGKAAAQARHGDGASSHRPARDGTRGDEAVAALQVHDFERLDGRGPSEVPRDHAGGAVFEQAAGAE